MERGFGEYVAGNDPQDIDPGGNMFSSAGPNTLAQLRADGEFVAANIDSWMWQSQYTAGIRGAPLFIDSLATALNKQ